MKNTFGSSLTMWYTINMEKLYEIKLDKDSELPLYRQVAEHILELRNSGELKVGTKLPPIRKLAASVGVNKLTIVNTYKYLEKQNAIYSHVGSGTYIADGSGFVGYSSVSHDSVLEIPHAFDMESAINFTKNGESYEFFPAVAFKDAVNRVLDRDEGKAFQSLPSWGYEPLRAEVCKDLLRYDIKADISDVQVVPRLGKGMDIIFDHMLSMGDEVIAETPTHHYAMGSFYYRKANVIHIDMQKGGMDLKQLENQLKTSRPKLIHVKSRFQTPTCYSYSLTKKRRLLELASAYDVCILEVDNESEFVYGEEKQDTTSLKALDTKGIVTLVKCYCLGVMPPGVDIAFIVHGAKTKSLCEGIFGYEEASPFMQRIFCHMLSSGDYRLHIEHMRKVYESRYETMIEAIDTNLKPYVEYKKPQGGSGLWLKLKDEKKSVQELANKLLRENVLIMPGSLYSIGNSDSPYISLSLAGLNEAQIKEGIKKIAQCLKSH